MGVSGGVDSSVSAALLKEQGHHVVGVFIKVWQPDFVACIWREERRDAMRVCATLDIPFLFMDLEEEYQRGVADYMIAEYKLGRTPNPDVMCNKYVKFGAFLKKALEMGADGVATGHYARVMRGKHEIRSTKSEKNVFNLENLKLDIVSDLDIRASNLNQYHLLAGLDLNKDQSYFLWTLTEVQLSKVVFPIGHLQKSEVRKLAEKFNLPTAQKKDSQGVCFIGKLDMKDFLKQFIKSEQGTVLNQNGEEIGIHDGAVFYTIGERHGFTITKKGIDDGRYYVMSKDVEKNTITVSSSLAKGRWLEAGGVNTSNEIHPLPPTGYSPLAGGEKYEIHISQTNWIPSSPQIGKKYMARCRYRQPLEKCEITEVADGKATIKFTNPQPTATPGQSLVVYDGEQCLGGGIIE